MLAALAVVEFVNGADVTVAAHEAPRAARVSAAVTSPSCAVTVPAAAPLPRLADVGALMVSEPPLTVKVVVVSAATAAPVGTATVQAIANAAVVTVPKTGFVQSHVIPPNVWFGDGPRTAHSMALIGG
jgi:hypothetical protein